MRVAGLGCRAEAPLASLREVLARVAPVDALATLAERAQLPALRALASESGLPLIAIEAIAGIATPTQSPRILARFGTGSVAEAVALAALPGGHIAIPRLTSTDGMATAALALRSTP